MKARVILGCSLAAMLLLMQSKAASGLKCYVCDSKLDIRCLEKHLPEDMKANCSSPGDNKQYNVCRTTYLHIEFPGGGVPPDNRTFRSCAIQHSPPPGRCYYHEGFGGNQKVCSCKGDYCNVAGRLGGNLAVLASLVAFVYMS